MPFLIKSSNGRRSCQLINNDKSPSSNDLINALKGLTIKLEIKITDVLLKEEKSEKPDEQAPEVAPPVAPKARETSVPKVSPPAVQAPVALAPSTSAPRMSPLAVQAPVASAPSISAPRVSPPVAQTSSIATSISSTEFHEPSRSASRQQATHEQTTFGPRRLGVLAPSDDEDSETNSGSTRPVKQEQVIKDTPKLRKMPSSAPTTINRGTIKVGSTIKSCPIAVDDYVKPPVAYIAYDDTKLMEIVNAISQISEEIETLPEITSINVGDVVLSKSMEDNQWYRAVIEAVNSDNVGIFFFDWGLHETVDRSRVRRLTQPELGLSRYPACALKLSFTNKSKALLDEVLRCDTVRKMKVESYDDATESYLVTVLEE